MHASLIHEVLKLQGKGFDIHTMLTTLTSSGQGAHPNMRAFHLAHQEGPNTGHTQMSTSLT